MPNVIKQLSIDDGVVKDTRDIGAEAQNITVSYDSSGKVINDISVTTPTSEASLATDLNNRAPVNHASANDDYGAADASHYGHVKVGNGLEIGANGSLQIDFGVSTSTSANEAVACNDTRLNNTRNTKNPIEFFDGVTIKKSFDGSSKQTVSYGDVGAAPVNHQDTTQKYGAATKNEYGHVKIGNGLNVNYGIVELKTATASDLGGVKPDGSTVTIDADGTLHSKGGGTGGSFIEISTVETSLYGKDVTIVAQTGSDPVTVTLDSAGNASVEGYMGTGAITLTATDGTQVATYNLTINYFGRYSVSLSFWSAFVNISTPTPELYGQEIIIKLDNAEVGRTNFNSLGNVTYELHAYGNYTFECTPTGGWKAFTSSLEFFSADEGQTKYTSIIGFISYIKVVTTSPDFIGQNIRITSTGQAPSATLTFDNSGEASYIAYEPATYGFSITYNDEPYSDSVIVDQEKPSTNPDVVTLNRWTAVVEVSTSTPDLFGQNINIKKQGLLVDTATFDASGKAVCAVHSLGTYSFEATLGWRTFSSSLEVEEERTAANPYPISIQGFVATVNIGTNEVDFQGKVVDVSSTDSEIPASQIVFSTYAQGDYQAVATYKAYKPGDYTFSVAVED